MTSELSGFAARLREFIQSSEGRVSRGPDPKTQNECEDSRSLPLRKDGFDNLALELFALQFKHNAPYRRFCAARGVSPANVADWPDIPAMPTTAFKELDLTCLPVAERTAVFHSSGTTEEQPSRHFHNAESLAVYEASLWAWFRTHVMDCRLPIADCRLMILTPPLKQAPHSSLVHMFETVRRELGAPESVFVGRADRAGSWTLDFDATLAALSPRAPSLAPQALLLLGTAFSFVHLLDFLCERNLLFQLPSGSRVMETGGYKGRARALPKPELHALITQRLGIPASHIVCEYGMSELSSQAYDTEVRSAKCEVRSADRLFRFPPWVRAQIISPETGRAVAEGETGLIRVFDLANVFSVMAVQTEDLGIRRDDGFELIGRAAHAERRGCSLMSIESLAR
jgi:Acyl-protein synthetase, LuxE